MNLLLVTCDPSPVSRSVFKFDFEHNTCDQLKDEAASLIADIAETKKEFSFSLLKPGLMAERIPPKLGATTATRLLSICGSILQKKIATI